MKEAWDSHVIDYICENEENQGFLEKEALRCHTIIEVCKEALLEEIETLMPSTATLKDIGLWLNEVSLIFTHGPDLIDDALTMLVEQLHYLIVESEPTSLEERLSRQQIGEQSAKWCNSWKSRIVCHT